MAEKMRKDQAHELIDKTADGSIWDDLIDEIYVRQVIDQGLADSHAGRTTDVSGVSKEIRLSGMKVHWTDTYRIIYYIKVDQIDVLAVLHGAQDIAL